MIEAEARWTKDAEDALLKEQSQRARGKVLKEVRRIRGSIDTTPKSRSQVSNQNGFVKLSEVQVSALEIHHESFLQTTGKSKSKDLAVNQGNFQPNDVGALLQKFKAKMKYFSDIEENEIAVTRLNSLSSQYVGPIGVGTVVEPPGCLVNMSEPSQSSPLIENDQLNQSTMMSKIGKFFFNQSSNFFKMETRDNSTSQMACQIKDQSKLWVVFDTGSTNLWISSDLCKDGPCRMEGRHIFNHSASATFSYPESMLQLTVQFGTGKIMGPQARDDFHIGPFPVYNQTFAMIETEDGNVFRDVAFEGIVGLAFPEMSANGVMPFFDSVIKQNALKGRNEFAFYFSKDKPTDNAIFWGGVDPTFYNGKLEYFPVVDPYYWSLKLMSFKIGNKQLLGAEDRYQGNGTRKARKWNGPVAIVDTGTTYFTAESSKFQEVMEMIPPSRCGDITPESHPPMTITLESSSGQARDFTLSNKQYMTSKGDGTRCSPAFMKIDLPTEHGPGMVLGEVFLRTFFAVFDRGTGDEQAGKIAFAESSDKDATFTRLHQLTAGQEAYGQKKIQASEPCTKDSSW
jgi:hypothetical protein